MSKLFFFRFRRFAGALPSSGILLGAVAALGLAGCQKEDECTGTCIEVKGRVGTEQGSATPLAGATIELSSIGNGSTFFSEPELFIKRVRSDANGYYSLSFNTTPEMRKRGHYRLLFYKQGHGNGAGGMATYENLRLSPGSSTQQNLHLPRPGGRLRVIVSGFPGGSAANSIYTTVETGRGGRGYLGIGWQPLLYATGTTDVAGASNTTDVSCETAANQYAHIRIYKMKAGVTTAVNDSIYCPANTLATYTHTF